MWENYLDYLADETTSINDIFDLVEEKKSEYGLWLFESINVSTRKKIYFPEYCHVVCSICMLERLDILQLIRERGSTNKIFLTVDDWHNIVNIMLSNEKIQYAKNFVISSFYTLSSKDLAGNPVLFLEDYMKVSDLTNSSATS